MVDSTGPTLNIASSLLMPSLLTAFSKNLLNVFATFVSFERSLFTLSNQWYFSLSHNFTTQKWLNGSPKKLGFILHLSYTTKSSIIDQTNGTRTFPKLFINICAFVSTAQKMNFSIKNFFSRYDQILSFQRIWSHLLKKSLMENFIFLRSVKSTLPFFWCCERYTVLSTLSC